MSRPIIPNKLFALLSWSILFLAVAAVGWSGLEVYNRHIRPDPGQSFNFGSLPEARAQGEVGLADVVSAHIFGTVPVKKKPKIEKPKVVEAPKTRLNLKLTGVVTAPIAENSHAMIEVERGQTSVVKVGSEIGKTGAALNAVFADHILIEHQGKLEKLVIERESLLLDDPGASNAQTISALNINVAEFEALAAVDPKDLDISRLLPEPVSNPGKQPDETKDGDGEKQQEEAEKSLKQQQEQAIRQQQAELRQQQATRQQQILEQQAAQQNKVDSQGRPVKQQVPGGLKQIN